MAALSQILKQATGVVADRGEGVFLYDEDDRRYLDFTAGIGVTSTGHCHPRVVAAAQEQVAKVIHAQYTTVMHRPLLTLVDVVVTVMNPGGAGPRRFDLPASVGILELEPGIPPRGRLVPLTPLDPD